MTRRRTACAAMFARARRIAVLRVGAPHALSRGMKKILCLFGVLSVLSLSACTTNTNTGADDVGEAREAVATYADMSAVKAAANAGTCVPGFIVVSDVPLYPVLADGVWSMSESGDEISRGACLQIKAGTILTAEDYDGEYENCIEAPAGIFQLAEVDGMARLIEP